MEMEWLFVSGQLFFFWEILDGGGYLKVDLEYFFSCLQRRGYVMLAALNQNEIKL
jgi:hypothetical protein